MFYVLNDESRRKVAIGHINGLNIAMPYSVEIKEYKKNRSTSQNRLYWSWLKVLSKDTGYTDDELHEQFKVRFLGVNEKIVEGVKLVQPNSTTDLTTTKFTDYLTLIELTATQMGINLHHPDDYRYAMEYGQSSSATRRPEGVDSPATDEARV